MTSLSSTGVVGAHLVGSVPLKSAEDVFLVASKCLGDRLERIPDGETGERSEWIHFQIPIIASTPGLRTVEFRIPDEVKLPPEVPREGITYGIESEAAGEELSFGDLRYADEAISSYQRFRELKGEGRIPDHIRFQVSLPTTLAVMTWIHPDSRPIVEPAYQKALLREVEKIVSAIPHDQLAIQFDLCMEVFMLEGYPVLPPWFDDVLGGVVTRVEEHSAAVPDDVELGFHLCYGDWKGERQAEPTDAGNLVTLANEISERLARPIGWIHLPVPRGMDAGPWAPPLANLRLHDETRLYLGLVHGPDSLDESRELAELCSQYVSDFGVATVCGIGRQPEEAFEPTLEVHREISAAVG
jgi:hypothetical protein